MSEQAIETYLLHPSFQEAMDHFQKGAWESGLILLDQLRALFPLDDELRTLRQEMQLKAKIDTYEIEEKKIARTQLLKKVFIRTTVSVVIVSILIWGGINYASWIQQQWNLAQQRIQSESMAIDLAIKYRNGQNLLLAGRATEAKEIFEEIAEISPEYLEVDYFLEEANTLITLDEQYSEAMSLLQLGSTQEALALFKEITLQKPLYKDVALQIDQIERGTILRDMEAGAKIAFQDENWDEAISAFETILALNPGDETAEIEQNLFQSYISAAETTLNDPAGTIEALEKAQEYFRKALALRPQNEEVLAKWAEAKQTIKDRLINNYLEQAQLLLADRSDTLDVLRESLVYLDKALALQPDDSRIQSQATLINNYLAAIDAYQKYSWGEVVALLEPVVREDRTFAKGVALQTLYEAYIAQGNDAMIAGMYDEALQNYQKAAVIAQQSKNATLLIFEAQINAAKTQGLLFNYEEAVSLYQSAIELIGLDTNSTNNKLIDKVVEADGLVAIGDYQSAYSSYEEAFRNYQALYETLITYTVEDGDYLTLIASRFNTSVETIVKANGIDNINNIGGRELVIPTLSDNK